MFEVSVLIQLITEALQILQGRYDYCDLKNNCLPKAEDVVAEMGLEHFAQTLSPGYGDMVKRAEAKLVAYFSHQGAERADAYWQVRRDYSQANVNETNNLFKGRVWAIETLASLGYEPPASLRYTA